MKPPTPAQIKKARESAKLTVQEAANAFGVNRVTWWRWEEGRTPMRPLLFQALQRMG